MIKPTVTKLLDEIVMILARDGKTIADLAREIGKDYHQTYDWIKRRQFNPQADVLMELMAWRNNNISVRGKRAAHAHT